MDLTAVVPAPLQASSANSVGIAVMTVESIFQKAGWNLRINSQTVIQRQPDGVIYDRDFNIRMDLINVGQLIAFANSVVGTPRRRYVVVLCEKIVEENARTGLTDDSGTNGASATGQAVSFVSIIAAKRTIGNSDGQTWAHEVGHGLGLDHVAAEDNLMYLSRRDTGNLLVGSELTGAQVAIMRTVEQALATTGL
jgi:hypothetical protein